MNGIGDPVMVLLLRVLSLVLSGTIILACIRAFIFFGGAIHAQKSLENTVQHAGQQFERFAEEVRKVLGDHEGRIIESRAMKDDHERRLTDLERRARGPRITGRGDEGDS